MSGPDMQQFRARHGSSVAGSSVRERSFKELLIEAHRARSAILRGRLTLVEGAPEPRAPSRAERARGGARPRLAYAQGALSSVHRLWSAASARHTASAAQAPAEVAEDATESRAPVAGDRRVPALRRADSPPAPLPQTPVPKTLPGAAARDEHAAMLDTMWRRGVSMIALFAGGLALWSVTMPMSSAVIASGQFVAAGSVKKVQHPTGGVVGQLFVREGDRVKEGDVLLRLDETVTRANLRVIVKQLAELAARRARLEAERDSRDDMEQDTSGTDANHGRIYESERSLFQARRAAREGQRAQLHKRIAQLREEVAGLRAQMEANASESQIIAQELTGVRDLYKKNLTPIMRLNALERQAVNLNGQRGQLASSIAQNEGKASEIELQVTQMTEDLRAEAQRELRDVESKIAELEERRVAAEDQLKRTEIRAPVEGTVHQLAAHTVGGVVTPAEPVMLVVPARDDIVLEAKVAPHDRDRLRLDQHAVVRLSTSDRGRTPEIKGTLQHISADVAKEPGGASSYIVRIGIAKAELVRLGSVALNPGMPADVFIETGSRTAVSYLLGPLFDKGARAFREH